MTAWVHAVVRSSEPDAVVAWLGTGDGGAEALSAAGARLWGVWSGRSGIGFRSDELVVSAWCPDLAATTDVIAVLGRCSKVSDVAARVMLPTARPIDDTPTTGDGVWVFREFELDASDVARFVELSSGAWETFDDGKDVDVVGLFRTPDAVDPASMLLVTRYADLATWEGSRVPARDPEAWKRFAERHGLTRWTRARSAVRVPM
jgi:hypothetical protein